MTEDFDEVVCSEHAVCIEIELAEKEMSLVAEQEESELEESLLKGCFRQVVREQVGLAELQ